MEYRHLGRSGLLVSEISSGNWVTHGSQVEQDAASACVHAALDQGITFFDTANVYARGKAEEALAVALKGERRSSYVLATKVMGEMGDKPTDKGLSRKHIFEQCHASLQRLNTDYVDLYQAHRYDPNTPLEETLRAFDDLVRAGKVLYVGISEWTAEHISDALAVARDLGLDRIISSQPQYHVLWRVIESDVVPLCREAGIGQIVWSPLAQGVLTGKYAKGGGAPERSRATDDHGKNMIQRWLRDEVIDAVDNLKPIAADLGLSMAQLALAWVLQNDNVSSAIIGGSRPEQVIDNAGAAGVKLTADVMEAIDKAVSTVVEHDAAKAGT
jgi:voltage-dependent potassium channel beta subunit